MSSTFEQYTHAAARLDTLIEHSSAPGNKSLEAVRERAEFRMGRLRAFLQYLGNPQGRYPIVHVGGTSGKGSTSTAIAAILTAAGYRTGLHISPYIQTPLEKLQLNGKLIDPAHFTSLVDRLLAAHQAWIEGGRDPLTYGELWMALTVFFFADAEVEIAVLEVGAGGRFDLTNVITPAVSVITSVGIDHTSTLGSTIEEIAWHKAGIIKDGVPAVTGVTHPAALEIIRAEAAARASVLREIPAMLDVRQTGADGTTWIDPTTGVSRTISLGGTFQARNGATAVAAVETLAASGFAIPDHAYAAGLAHVRIPGRIELIQDRAPVMLDGAHNPEKVAALARDVPQLLPRSETSRLIAVVGVLEAKQADEMFRSLVPVVDVIVATSPQVLAKEPRHAGEIEAIARAAGFSGPVFVEPEPLRAIETALSQVREDAGDAILVTGSLYLVGNIRSRWYDEKSIVLQQTSWPTGPGTALNAP